MYQVIIVDDEPIIRNGIQAYIDWEKQGLTVVDAFSNGEEALTFLENGNIDILITDIKMPLLDGIQLMGQALKLNPQLKVILLSSYSDFGYAREGLKLGAVDYILKGALKPEELHTALQRCISILDEERRKESEFQQGAVYRERKNIEQKIKRLIVQEQVPQSSTIWAPDWLEKSYGCCYLILDKEEELRENNGYLHVQLLMEDLQELFYKETDRGVAFVVAEIGLFILLPDKEGNAEFQLREWKQSAEKEFGISMSAGYQIEQGIRQILQGFAGSLKVCQIRFFEGLGRFHKWEGSNGLIPELAQTESPDWKPFFEIIRKGDPVSSAMEFAIECWTSRNLDPEQIKKEASELLLEAYVQQKDAGMVFPEQLDMLRRTETLDEMASLLKRELEEIGKPVMPKLSGSNGQKIMKALEYIADHYTENLTLQSVADTVKISKTYFSILFKKKTSRNFVDYLIDLRIREAKRLLAEENGLIYHVAESAGFNDVKYFNRLFKQLTGLTPLEYRKKHQSAG